MFRKMRREKYAVGRAECEAMLERGSHGVLAVSGDNGYPYTVPLNYVFYGGKIYFHCALEGHKLDAIAGDDRVSFCVVDFEQVIPADYNTLYRSAVAFGRAALIDEPIERRAAQVALLEKYASDHMDRADEVIERNRSTVGIVGIVIEHLSGKAGR